MCVVFVIQEFVFYKGFTINRVREKKKNTDPILGIVVGKKKKTRIRVGGKKSA